MNDPRRGVDDNAFYASMLLYGNGAEQPGVVLLNSWQARNNAICARLVQLAKPDDRIVVVYGSWAFLSAAAMRARDAGVQAGGGE